MLVAILLFLAYSAFCYWIIVMDGAETLSGLESFFLLGWFASTLTPTELKFYVGISWLAGLVLTLYQLFQAGAG